MNTGQLSSSEERAQVMVVHARTLEGVAKSQFALHGSLFQVSNASHENRPTRVMYLTRVDSV